MFRTVFIKLTSMKFNHYHKLCFILLPYLCKFTRTDNFEHDDFEHGNRLFLFFELLLHVVPVN